MDSVFGMREAGTGLARLSREKEKSATDGAQMRADGVLTICGDMCPSAARENPIERQSRR